MMYYEASLGHLNSARLAQSVEHETPNLRVVGSSPTLGDILALVDHTVYCAARVKT